MLETYFSVKRKKAKYNIFIPKFMIPIKATKAGATLLLLFIATASFSQVVVPFKTRYSSTQKGNIVHVANSIVTCTGSGCGTAQAQIPPAGTNNNNDFNTAYIDIDGNATTFSSSSSVLTLPACSYITYAGLYWGADANSSTTGFGTRDQIKFRTPAAAAYNNITADTMITTNVGGHDMYACYKNVTSYVSAGGNGNYFVANVIAKTGSIKNISGGWTLVIAYRNDLSNLRNLTVWDGYIHVTNGVSTLINISGFQTPISGPVSFEVGITTYDGDRNGSPIADSLLFNDNLGTFVAVSNVPNPANNIYNSSITYNGANVATRNPNYQNTLGFDDDVFIPNNALKNYLGNNQTSCTIKQTTGGENIYTQVITSAIDVYEPDVRIIKTATDLNGGLTFPGDTIQYDLQVINQGSDTASSMVLVDSIPFNATYVANSLQILSGPNSGNKTDATADDQAEYINVSKFVRFRIGIGANSVGGGKLGQLVPTNESIIRFKVVVTSNCELLLCSNIVTNQARVSCKGVLSGSALVTSSQPNGFDALGCPLYGPTQTVVQVPSSCTNPADTSISVCSSYNFSSLSGVRSGYSYFNNSYVSVASTTTSGVYYGIKAITASCRDTFLINLTINPLPNFTGTTLTHPTCTNGGATGGRITLVGTFGANDSVSYFPGASFITGTFTRISTLSPANTITNIVEGTKTVRVKNAAGCYVDQTVVLSYINCSPLAIDDNYSFNATANYSASVASNDDEPDLDPWTFTLLSGPANGSLTFNANGTFTYSPGAFRGTTSFTYVVCDNRTPALCDTAVVTFTVISPLPVELGLFNGEIKNNGILLKWLTYSELNNDFFELQRSSDGVRFNSIAKVSGHGTTTEMYRYQYLDDKPFGGWNYYRLKQVDFNGEAAITNTVKFNLSSISNNKVEIIPNPNNGIFRAKINCDVEGESKITVVSQYGAVLYETSAYCTGQSVIKQIELTNIPKGLYYLLVNSKNQTGKYKFTVN